MKKTILFVLMTAFCAGAAFSADGAPAAKAGPAKAEAAAKHDCANCPMHKKEGKKCAGMACPEKLKGVETVSKNIENGIEMTMTAKDKETIAKVQELAPVHYAAGARKCPGCPTAVPGAETKYENIPGGIKVTVTGKTPEAVKQIQEASAKAHQPAHAGREGRRTAAAAKKYACPMGDYTGDKPGKCPKCGMELKEQK